MLKVTIIGGGIIGASVAWSLARAGSRVLVLERGAAPATETSAASFSRATAFGKGPRSYFDLNHAGLKELHSLRSEGMPGFNPCPSLVWSSAAEQSASEIDDARRWGYDAEEPSRAGGEVRECIDPAVLPPTAAFLPGEGWVDLPTMAAWMLDQARGEGADVRFGAEAAQVTTDSGGAVRGIVTADGRARATDVVVNAAGARAQEAAGLVGGPLVLAPTRGLLVDLPLAGDLGTMLITPEVSIRPAGPGRVRVRSGHVDSRLGAVPPTAELLDTLARDLAERAAALVPALAGARPEPVRVGVRAVPADGLSSVGFLGAVPGYFEAVTHSGATLGPLLGRLAAQEITLGRRSPLLSPYSPDRFASRGAGDAGAVQAPATDNPVHR